MGYLEIFDRLLEHPNPFRIPVEEANDLRLELIQCAFEHQYKNNRFYREFCDHFKVKPDDIKEFDDITRIPLITSDFFKQISAYGEKDIYKIISVPPEEIVVYFTTSGTTGKASKYPFDRESLIRLNKSNAKILECIGEIDKEDRFVFLTPDLEHTKTGLVHGMYQSIEIYIGDKKKTKDQVFFTIKTDANGNRYYDVDGMLRFIDESMDVHLFGPPFAYKDVAEMLIERGYSLDLKEKRKAFMSGGWKGRKEEMIPRQELESMITEVYGVNENNIRDGLGLTDIFSWLLECCEKEKHVPPWMHVSTRKESEYIGDIRRRAAKNEDGIIAFLSPIITSYPAFITTGDIGALTNEFNENCKCGRIGPTVEYRRRSGDPRGCALRELEKMQSEVLVVFSEKS